MRVVILGKGGHAKVLKNIFDHLHIYTLQTDDNDFFLTGGDGVAIGVGNLQKRLELWQEFQSRAVSVVHPSAVIADTKVGPGVQIMAGVVIQPGAFIKANTLINTRASVDHDCDIGFNCHIAPGAILCGDVTLGDGCFIGAGAVIVQGVTLEEGTFIPAGSLVCGPDDIRRPQRLVQTREVAA